MRTRHGGGIGGAAALALVLCAAGRAGAQAPEASGGAWHVNASGTFGSASGEYGDVVEKPFVLDLGIAKGRGAWRFGAGFEFRSLAMKPPYEDQLDWSRMVTYGTATRLFNQGSRLRPYLQGRVEAVRMHPRSEVLRVIPPEEFQAGHDPTEHANGFGFSLAPGVLYRLNDHLSLDLAAVFSVYQTSDLDLSAIGQPSPSSGNDIHFRAGIVWEPLAVPPPPMPAPAVDPQTGHYAALPPADSRRDGWGVPRSWGWATAEMLGINFVATALNEYTRGESSYPITPRTIGDNFDLGFKFDDNEFKTNQLIHPFNGGTYYNSARSNGIGFWGSAGMAIAGAFLWECCGESQPMSWNDMISTSLGGISRGETSYRLAAMILDNTKRGKGRFWRELGAAPVNPVGQFNRLLSGRAGKVQGNPENPYDWRPPQLSLHLAAGVRVIGEGSSISENTNTYGLIELDLAYGSAFDNERRKPFDRFDAGLQMNLGDKSAIGRIQIRGDLWSKPLGGQDGQPPRNALALIQDFDYVDNEAYEYGGQAFGLALFSRYGKGTTRLTTRVTGFAVVGAAVNADYSFLADIPEARQHRNYDYGAGLGGGLEAVVTRRGHVFAGLGYRYTYIDVRNGSIFSPRQEVGFEGSSAHHQVHRVRLFLTVPLVGHWGLGAESTLFYRDSDYSAVILADKTQRNPEARAFVSWTWSR